MVKLLMIDNYDSFTHNLVRYFNELGQQVVVYRNDQISVQAICDMAPTGVIISPGPGTPSDAGISLATIERFAGQVPILGVCLGHQAIAQAYGANVVRANQVMHGKTSLVAHHGQGLFAGLPPEFRVTRYHSLLVAADTLPNGLVEDAWVAHSAYREIMGIRDSEHAVYGIQFHPESVLTEYGHHILAAFCAHAGLPVSADLSELSQSLR